MPEPRWKLRDFEFYLDLWISQESPDQDVLNQVLVWMQSRMDDPFEGVQREENFPNMWWAWIPRTSYQGTAVLCSYFVFAETREVHCKSLATLNR